MISYLNDPSAELLQSYLPPFKGTWKTLPAHVLPPDVVQDSMNVTLLNGKLRSRLGLSLFDLTNLGGSIVGSFLFTGVKVAKAIIASTKNKVYKYTTGWSDITGALILNGSDHVRMTSIQIGSSVYLLYANGTEPLRYSEEAGNINPIIPRSNQIPVFTDICTSDSRIIGITPPFTVSWCDVLNNSYLSFTNWPSLNQVVASDTEDSLVAIGPLGTLGFALYKEGNIFNGIGQTGPQSSAFRFEHRGEYQGPANPNARINWNGSHVYMTVTGRVGLYNGSNHDWICDGLWPFLQDDLDKAYTSKIFGVYNYATSEITFWYPRKADNGSVQGMLVINTPYPTAGIQSFSYFLGLSAFECTNALSVRFFQTRTSPIIFSHEGSNFYSYSPDKTVYTDGSTTFRCGFSTGLFKPSPQPTVPSKDKSDIYRPVLEVYSTRDATRGLLELSALTVNALENDGNSSEAEILDLTVVRPNEFVGFNDTGSFIGIKAEWDSTAKFEYKGCDVYGRKT